MDGVPSYAYSAREGVKSIVLLSSETGPKRFLLEGGPGQGKSTVTQMLAQLYRSVLLGQEHEYPEFSGTVQKARIPIRIELRLFAEWLSSRDESLERYIAEIFTKDAGGNTVAVADIHSMVEDQPVLLILDGLDEVGSDSLREKALACIFECVQRLESDLGSDLKVILTTRPPAVATRLEALRNYLRVHLLPLNDERVTVYVDRWTIAQSGDPVERERIIGAFSKRKSEVHVHALVKNPMQLSVLLQFIRLKGEAFPDRRAELYRDYFKIVIDRDVEKSPDLLKHREDIETIHELLGLILRGRAEANESAASVTHSELISIVRDWLISEEKRPELAEKLFRVGQERLALIVATAGEGASTEYGFEIQPVREYFAAAFINDKGESNAHNLFQLMAQRPFWREVALFLAGLRRANEKADLLSRARALDDDGSRAWRGDGRSITLQLLQEGVLTSPGHVRKDALLFLIDALDPDKFGPRFEPAGFLDALSAMIRLNDNPQLRGKLFSIVGDSVECKDYHFLRRLWSVAGRCSSSEELVEAAAAYKNIPELVSHIGLRWTADKNFCHARAFERSGAFKNVKPEVLAEDAYSAVFKNSKVTELESIPAIHDLLIERFAFETQRFTGAIEKPARPFAVWALLYNMHLLGDALRTRTVKADPLSGAEVDYTGLSSSSKDLVCGLVEDSAQAIESLVPGNRQRNLLTAIFKRLEYILSQDGITAWIGCRCTTI